MFAISFPHFLFLILCLSICEQSRGQDELKQKGSANDWCDSNNPDVRCSPIDSEEEMLAKLFSKEVLTLNNEKFSLFKFFGEETLSDFLEVQPDVIGYLLKKKTEIPELCSENLVNFEDVKSRILKVYEKIEYKKLENFLRSITESIKISFVVSGDDGSKNLLKQKMNSAMVTIITSDDPIEFYKICREKWEHKIYWLHFSQDSIELREIFDPSFYIDRYFYPQIMLFPESIEKALFKNNGEDEEEDVWDEDELVKDEPVIISKPQDPTKIEISSSKLIWLSSNGSIKDIREMALLDDSVELTELEFGKADKKVVIIADEPGMGKSTTLLNIATKMKDTWKIWINLNSISKEIPKYTPNLNTDTIVKLLKKSNTNLSHPLIASILKYSLSKQTSIPIILFFDGFDKLNETAQTNMTQIFKFIRERTHARLWITTRALAKNGVEQALNTLAVRMKEITEAEQLDFLTNVWKSKLLTLKDEARFNEMAKKLLIKVEKALIVEHTVPGLFQKELVIEIEEYIKRLKNIQTSFNLQELLPRILEYIKHIHLYYWPKYVLPDFDKLSGDEQTFEEFLFWACRLTTEEMLFTLKYFETHYNDSQNLHIILQFIYNQLSSLHYRREEQNSLIGIPLKLRMIADMAQPEVEEPEKLFKNFYDMYNKFVSRKIHIYFKQKLQKESNEFYEKTLFKKHENLGFQQLFPELAKVFLDADEILDWENESNKKEIAELNAIGLVNILESKFEFVHYSLAEYFATEKIINLLKKIQKWSSPVLEKLIETDILITEKYYNIRKFLNDYVQEENPNIFSFLNDKKKIYNAAKYYQRTPLDIAVKEKNDELAKVLLDSYKCLRGNNVDETHYYLPSLLYMAIRGGNSLDLINKIINLKPRHGFFEIENENDLTTHTYGVFDEYGIVIIKTSFKSNKFVIIEDKAEIHKIIKEKSLVFPRKSLGSFIRYTIDELEPDILEQILKKYPSLMEEEWLEIFMSVAIKENKKKIVELLLKMGADIDGMYKGETPLIAAISHKKYNIAKFLIDRGADFDIPNVKDETPVQIAFKKGYISILLKLLKKGADIDDIDGLSPISIAVLKNDANSVRKLINNPNTDIKASIAGKTLLQVAVMNNRSDVIMELLKRKEIRKGIDKYFSDEEMGLVINGIYMYDHYYTPLLYAVEKRFTNVANILLEYGADVNIVNSNSGSTLLSYSEIAAGKPYLKAKWGDEQFTVKEESALTALHIAVKVDDKEMVKKLIDLGADINARCRHYNGTFTPVFRAAYNNNWDMVKILIAEGADTSALLKSDPITGKRWFFELKIETLHSLAKAAGQTDVLKMLGEPRPLTKMKKIVHFSMLTPETF